ncbi:MAG: hypothetical protein IKH45_06825 [Neisseriaceae bacterium]|nr:hypothetical protein [Neisseriaceae bacterium]
MSIFRLPESTSRAGAALPVRGGISHAGEKRHTKKYCHYEPLHSNGVVIS